jgi:hypothetical protein
VPCIASSQDRPLRLPNYGLLAYSRCCGFSWTHFGSFRQYSIGLVCEGEQRMTTPTQAELIVEFGAYVRDVLAQPVEQQGNKLETVLAQYAASSVRLAASSLLPADVDLAAATNDEIAEHMQRHVVFRGGSRMENSAWTLMLEAAKRLRAYQQKAGTE